VTLVAIDDSSAARLEELPASAKTILDPGQNFTSVASYEADLAALVAFLQTNRLNYRVFTTTVSIRQAKWSEQ